MFQTNNFDGTFVQSFERIKVKNDILWSCKKHLIPVNG